jgi:hypothetical protein
MENQGAGAVILYHNKSELETWLKSTLDELCPEEHGDKYTQQFIIQELNPDLSVCFYVLTGYATQAENLAFEHAFFILDEFIEDLEDTAPKGKYLILVDTGTTFEEGEWRGFDAVNIGLAHFDINLETIRFLRKNIQQTGGIIWTT